jgi:catechol 2,3-dioxygenase-like lactoylglutathione lyase family enzyme
MALKDVIVVSVPVSDQERARAFYVDQLGFELVRDDDTVPGLHWVQVKPKGGGTSLTLVTWFDTMPAGSLQGLVLTSSDIQADYEELVAKGVEFEGPPERQSYATAETVFHDPDGNKLVLQQA